MPLDFRSYPEDDSPDLSDEEIEGAAETKDAQDLQEKMVALIHLSCGSCSGSVQGTKSALRRRKPHLFSRTEFKCENGHVWTRTFRIDGLARR